MGIFSKKHHNTEAATGTTDPYATGEPGLNNYGDRRSAEYGTSGMGTTGTGAGVSSLLLQAQSISAY
jgi:hypothetical protein